MGEHNRKAIKISGYLEKKGKMRMVWTWKKYWFVLEGRLLLYYRSRDEYEAISPCKGSINFGPPCCVKPCPSYSCGFQIQTRSNTFTFRAENRAEQEKWMEAILSALNQKQPNSAKLSHFRYSLDDLASKTAQDNFVRQNTMPERVKMATNNKNDADLVRRPKHGGSLNSIAKTTSKLPKSGNVTKMLSNGSLYASLDVPNVEFSSKTSLVIENIHYAKIIPKSGSFDNVVLRERRQDVNENIYERVSSVDFNNPKRSKSDENIYAIPKIDHNRNSLIVDNEQYIPTQNDDIVEYYPVQEGLYEDPDRLKMEETSSQSSSSDTKQKRPSRLRNFKEKFKKTTTGPKDPNKTLKKSYSFVQKVLKRRPKTKKIENDYENVDLARAKSEDDANLKMLSELHEILLKKKNALETYTRGVPNGKNAHNGDVVELYKPPNFFQEDDVHPNLPPKLTVKSCQNKKGNLVKLRQPANNESGKLKTIDEILDDLDKEKQEQESKPKVRQLIKQFSGAKLESEVTLRRPIKGDLDDCKKRHSDDLCRLLEELAKVTSAPILTPGATSSLVTPTLTDEEWLKLLPIRKRRFSDPDYDVPRPHRSLQIKPREENPENVIPATRFFGPVLPSVNLEENRNQPSITPDSLDEIDQIPTESYSSHHYYEARGKTVRTANEKSFDIETEPFAMYSKPKKHHHEHSINIFVNRATPEANTQRKDPDKETTKEPPTKPPEVFIDSLEPYAEISTSF